VITRHDKKIEIKREFWKILFRMQQERFQPGKYLSTVSDKVARNHQDRQQERRSGYTRNFYKIFEQIRNLGKYEDIPGK
jgi:hypothetical protein